MTCCVGVKNIVHRQWSGVSFINVWFLIISVKWPRISMLHNSVMITCLSSGIVIAFYCPVKG